MSRYSFVPHVEFLDMQLEEGYTDINVYEVDGKVNLDVECSLNDELTETYLTIEEAERLIRGLQNAVEQAKGVKNPMTNEEYRIEIERTMNPELTEKEKLSMLALGLAGEAGEVVDSIKKIYYHGHPMKRKDLVKELGDFEWYSQHIKKHFGIADSEIYEANIAKLQKRYKEGFSEKASLERVDTLPDE
jgi:NTP pyrophosphatase (non-canonical NTP hydrolase)